MVLKGFIKEVGDGRSWLTKDGESRQSVRLTVAVPYVSKAGEERNDWLMGEVTVPNAEFVDELRRTCAAGERCEFQVGFRLSEWNGRKIQNIKVYNVSKLMG
jgi:hypothetical protein